MSDFQILAPGPIIGGKDIFATAVGEAYAKANFSVIVVDDWFDHHMLDGEIYCGNMVYRDASTLWW